MTIQLLAYNGAIIPTLEEGFRLNPDVGVHLAHDDRGIRVWRRGNWDDAFECAGQNLLCSIGESGGLYLLDVFAVLQRLVDLHDHGHDPVIPLEEIVADFTIPTRG